MIQAWNLRTRAHQCAVTERKFVEGEKFYTAIYFNKKTGDYTRRDVSADAWAQDIQEHPPFSFWKSAYEPPHTEERLEVTPKENAGELLHRLIVEDEAGTEQARYILALMLERKRILVPTAVKHSDAGRLLMYENKKTGEVFVIRDPELRLDEIEAMQEEVATLLGFSKNESKPKRAAAVNVKPGAVAD